MLQERRKEGEKDFLQKIANTSDIQGVNTIWNMMPFHHTVPDFMVY